MAGMYSDLHRLLLQWLMTHKVVTQQKAMDMYHKVCEIYKFDYKPSDFAQCIAQINEQLKPLSMEVRHGKSEDNGIKHYCLVNCFEDEHSKMATDFSANEIALFRKALDSIIMSDDGDISMMNLINLGSDLPIKVNPAAVESLLIKLVEEKWLTEIDGNISLGPRTIIELGVYLKNIYSEDVPDCKLCMDIVVKGQTCGNCGIKLHLYCSNFFFKDRPSNTRKCPGCKVNWLHEIPKIVCEPNETDMETVGSSTGSQRHQHEFGRNTRHQPTR